MMMHLKSVLADRLKNRNDESLATVGDLRMILKLLEAMEKEENEREERIWGEIGRAKGYFLSARDEFVTQTAMEELVRERIYPLHVAVTGKKPPPKRFEPISMERMG